MPIVSLFPLPMIAFPGETLALHIFEDRYKEMISLCLAAKRPFCIVSVQKGQIARVGTLIQIDEVTKTYEDGKLDLLCTGFERVEILRVLTKKSFYEAEIIPFDDLPNDESEQLSLQASIQPHFSLLMEMASKEANHNAPIVSGNAFGYAQYVGFDLAKKQEILELRTENLRLALILAHLEEVVPKIQTYESVKNRIIANGDYRKFPPLDLNL